MSRWAIGDVQGCDAELGLLLARLGFKPDRDRLWFTGDIVNRGPASLAALRRVRALGDNAIVVLGNHDLHLLAVALADKRPKRLDTLAEILAAPDCDALLEWLLARPLAHWDGDLLVHAGLLPQWDAALVQQLAAEAASALRAEPRAMLGAMYGDQPDRWDPALRGTERWRLVVNALTRMRVCDREGRIDLKFKAAPAAVSAPLMPWFTVPRRASRATRIVFGHWSALGLYRADNVLALDTGCVWGGALTAVDLDDAGRPPVSVAALAA